MEGLFGDIGSCFSIAAMAVMRVESGAGEIRDEGESKTRQKGGVDSRASQNRLKEKTTAEKHKSQISQTYRHLSSPSLPLIVLFLPLNSITSVIVPRT